MGREERQGAPGVCNILQLAFVRLHWTWSQQCSFSGQIPLGVWVRTNSTAVLCLIIFICKMGMVTTSVVRIVNSVWQQVSSAWLTQCLWLLSVYSVAGTVIWAPTAFWDERMLFEMKESHFRPQAFRSLVLPLHTKNYFLTSVTLNSSKSPSNPLFWLLLVCGPLLPTQDPVSMVVPLDSLLVLCYCPVSRISF